MKYLLLFAANSKHAVLIIAIWLSVEGWSMIGFKELGMRISNDERKTQGKILVIKSEFCGEV